MEMKTFSVKCFSLLLLLTINNVTSASEGLKWVRVHVPEYRFPGETATLQCDYELGNDALYSVKWYKDHEEFYSFLPKQKPPAHSYAVDGVNVDVSQSNSRKVLLRSVNINSSGLYRCEVSAEAPSFASAQSEGRMEIVALPKEDPTISGVEMQYQIGDEINLNCSSGKSHPASILHWYINEKQVTNPEFLIKYPLSKNRQGLVSSKLGIRFILTSQHFQGGSMRVRCVASVPSILWRGNKESVVQQMTMKTMREALVLVHTSSSTTVTVSSNLLLGYILITQLF